MPKVKEKVTWPNKSVEKVQFFEILIQSTFLSRFQKYSFEFCDFCIAFLSTLAQEYFFEYFFECFFEHFFECSRQRVLF